MYFAKCIFMIPRETIDQIYTTAKIEDVIGDYMSLRRRGANLWGNCPFHDEKTPSFSVSPAKGIYKCFGCGKAGNAVNFVMEYEQCSYSDALKQIAAKYRIEVKEKEMTDEEKQQESERESLFKVNEWANKWFQHQLWETQEGRNIGLRYFVERGLREDIIHRFQLGYSPEANALYPSAKQAGYQDEFLERTGLCGISQHDGRRYDRFRDRVIFPIFTISGKVVAFAGRILKNKEHTGKYVNSPDSAIYSKQNELYGLFQAKQAIAKQQMCYLVEGQMDVISMFQSGIENVVSSGGTSLTLRQVKLLHRLTENVTILYDGDSAGIHAALRGIDMLLEEGLNIKVVLLPDGEDPDSFSRKMNAIDFRKFLNDNSQDFIRFKTNLLLDDAGGDPIKRSNVIKDIVQSIAVIPDLITRRVYIKDTATLLDFREDALLKDTNRIRREKYSKHSDNGPAPEPAATEQLTKAVPEQTSEPKQIEAVNSKIEQNIINLLQVLVRYGDYPIYQMSVGQYIIEELTAADIKFENSLYNKVLHEYTLHHKDNDFKAEQFFKFHQDSEISMLAINLMSEQYSLSKMFGRQNISENVQTETSIPTDADRLDRLVPQLIYELQLSIVKERESYIVHALKHAQENHQDEQIIQLVKENMQLKELEKDLSKYLGNRVLG